MRRAVVTVVVLFAAAECLAYTWTQLGPPDSTFLDCYFHPLESHLTILCTTSGLLVGADPQWDYCSHMGLPVRGVTSLDSTSVLLCAGDGGVSDGVYRFDLVSHHFDSACPCMKPHFVTYVRTDNRLYAGCQTGLLVSVNAVDWEGIGYFDQKDCIGLQGFQGHLVASADDTVFLADESGTPQIGSRVDAGLIEHGPIDEASGIAASRRNRDVLWTHNDSGGANAIYAFSAEGAHLGVYRLGGVVNRDWEDMAIGYDHTTDAHYIYVGDVGDNGNVHQYKFIHKVIEPCVSSSQPAVDTTLTGVETITFTYPGGIRYNAETVMIDPLTNDLYVVTKLGGGSPDIVFRAPYPQSTSQPIVLEEVGTLCIPTASVTVGGDISPSGSEIITKTYSKAYHWRRQSGESIWATLQNQGVEVPYVQEPQGEAICWKSNAMGYYTVSEEAAGVPAHLYFYPRETWHPAHSAPDSLCDIAFDPDGVLYGVRSGTSCTSGLWSSTDHGETWTAEFYSECMTSVALDSNAVVFVGWGDAEWDTSGVAIWSPTIGNLTPVSAGMPGLTVHRLVESPLLGSPSVTCCTDSGAASVTGYFGPAMLRIRVVGSASARLWWYPVPAATHYDVYRSTAPYAFNHGTPWSTVLAPVTHVDFTEGIGDTAVDYFFTARVRNATQVSEGSNVVGEVDFELGRYRVARITGASDR